jgi:hypothetical protein
MCKFDRLIWSRFLSKFDSYCGSLFREAKAKLIALVSAFIVFNFVDHVPNLNEME